jgi:hypothetical protein
MKSLFFLFVLSVFAFEVLGQNAQIKKQIIILNDYYDFNRGGQIKVDTSIIVFDSVNIEPDSIENIEFRKPIRTILVDSSKKILIKHHMYLDSSTTVFKKEYLCNKSIVTWISNKDTATTVNKHNLIRTKTLFYRNSTCIDKSSFDIIFRTERIFRLNTLKNEWYVEKKKKFNKHGFETKCVYKFYNAHWKRYYKEVTKYKYDKGGKLIMEIKFDSYRVKEKVIKYSYEYY